MLLLAVKGYIDAIGRSSRNQGLGHPSERRGGYFKGRGQHGHFVLVADYVASTAQEVLQVVLGKFRDPLARVKDERDTHLVQVYGLPEHQFWRFGS
jgi:hypothetical protein